MTLFSQLFILTLIISTGIQFYLAWRQIASVRRHRSKVPQAFVEKITLEEHQKAADYSLEKQRFSIWTIFFGVLLLLIWTFGGGLELLDQFWRNYDLAPLLTGVGVILSMMLISQILELPLALYSTFVIEEKHGFNKSTLKLFFTDMLKGLFVGALIGVPLVLIVLWLMEQAGPYWWLYAWLVLGAFTLILQWAYPLLIAPLFNKFTPLEDENLKARINDLITRSGFKSNGLFVMDGSKRSGHGNAYFSGFGKNKRIVFFDTLLKQLEDTQIEAVLAHELGHFKHRHIIKGMLLSFAISFLGLALLAWIMKQPWFYSSFGITEPSNWLALLLFSLLIPVFSFPLGPLFSALSRRHEYQADAFAAKQTDAQQLINALVNMYRENASTLTPDWLYSLFNDSHPPAALRISHLKQS